MHRPSRRGVTAVALVATLGTSAAPSTAVTAKAADDQAQTRGLLDGLVPALPIPAELAPVLDTINGLAPTQVTDLVNTLTPEQLGQLLGGANLEQLTNLVVGLTPEQIQQALATLTPQQQEAAAGNVQAAQAAAAAKKPAATAPASTAKPFTAYRARIGSIKVAKTRKSVSFKVVCPSIAPKGCLTRVTIKVGGKKAGEKDFLIGKNASATATVKLTSAATKRLKSKGGNVSFSVQTVQSTVGTLNRSVSVKKDKKAKKAAKS